MMPVIEGMVARRVLLNYWADPSVIRPLVPDVFELSLREGMAVVGVCLIRLEQMRPKGWPTLFGFSSENMAHRVAILFREAGKWHEGVYILRRETDSAVVARFGGRLFPGVHQPAQFRVQDEENSLAIHAGTVGHEMDVSIRVRPAVEWKPTPLFRGLCEVSAFFRSASCGFSCAITPGIFEGMELRAHRWEVRPLAVREAHSAFFDNPYIFPPGSIGLDGAILMRNIPVEWHVLPDIQYSVQSIAIHETLNERKLITECRSKQEGKNSFSHESELIAK